MSLAPGLSAILATTLLLGGAVSASAQECSARVLAPVTDDLGNTWKPGQTLPVDIARGDSFCASRGACVPQHSSGARALQLTNCVVGPSLGDGDKRLVADAKLGSASFASRFARRSRAEARLSALGFSSAAAGGFAGAYANQPRSKVGRLVARALNGSSEAIAALRSHEP